MTTTVDHAHIRRAVHVFGRIHTEEVITKSIIFKDMLGHADPGKIPETENLPSQVEGRERPKKVAGNSSLVIIINFIL